MATIDALNAANAYRNQLKLMQNSGAPDSSEDNAKPSFSKMVEGAVKEAIDTQYNAEAKQVESLTTGKVELSDLVTAVANADLTLNTVVAIRDRVITAYEDIIKMPI
jgi:flagellar hook-basal body complex protein FliE